MVEKDEGRWGRQRTVDGDPPRSRARSRRLGTRKSARRRSAEHAPRKRYLYTSLRFFLGISMMTECCLSTTSARLEGWLSTLEGRADGTETREERCVGSAGDRAIIGRATRERGDRAAPVPVATDAGSGRAEGETRDARGASRARTLAMCAWKRATRRRGPGCTPRDDRREAPRCASGPLAWRAARRGFFVFVFDAAISSASASRPSRPNRERGLGVRFEIKRSFPESTLVIRRKRIRRRCGRLSDAASGAFADARGFR